MTITPAVYDDLPAILALQYRAYQSEAELLQDFSIPPLCQTLASLQEEFARGVVLKAVEGDAIIGSVRAHAEESALQIGKLIVEPSFQGRGIGTRLLQSVELACPAARYELFTSSKSEKNLRLYERAGYRRFAQKEIKKGLTFIYLEKTAE
ncbi:MAG: GNAT family N-acetyltransferase [Christensenella sp.]|nr:GNAT family N-acetyltransferase [Christensenella sp.]